MCYNVCALANNFAHLKINRHMFFRKPFHFGLTTDKQLATISSSSNYIVSNPEKYRHMLVCAKRKSTRMNYVKKIYHKQSTKISCNFNLFSLLSFYVVFHFSCMCYNVCALQNNFAHHKIKRHMFFRKPFHFGLTTDKQLATIASSSNYIVSNPEKYRHMLVCAKRKCTRMKPFFLAFIAYSFPFYLNVL